MKTLFVGGGNMASALIGGLLKQAWQAADLGVVEVLPQARERLTREYGVKVSADFPVGAAQTIVLAVKPQQLPEVARQLGSALSGELVVTIAAGIRTADLSRWLGGHRRIVRAMPNTPALVLAGVSALYAMPGVSEADRAAAEGLLAAVGTTLWVPREDLMDAVTAVSGSGPAYVFYFIEAIQQAAEESGLTPEQARQLTLGTFAGATRLAMATSEPPAQLRAKVTSKGGTTERALAHLESRSVKREIAEAVRLAAERSKQLGDEFGKA